MPIIPIEEAGDARLALYRGVSDPELLRRGGLFIVEGRQVVRTALEQHRFAIQSVVLTRTALQALDDAIAPRLDTLTVFLVADGTIEAISGFNIHRGCLAVGVRPSVLTVETWLAGSACPPAAVVVAAESIANADNMGGLFRNAAAFGAAAVVSSAGSCDPFYRKAIRVSMGSVFRVPSLAAGSWPSSLAAMRDAGFVVAALTPAADAMPLEAFVAPRPDRPKRIVLLVGNEGAGLSDAARAAADVAVRIPMVSGFDSINVATAAGIALYRWREASEPGQLPRSDDL